MEKKGAGEPASGSCEQNNRDGRCGRRSRVRNIRGRQRYFAFVTSYPISRRRRARYDHHHILAGAGTMGLEIMEQVKNVDAVITPVGGGGLIAGVAVAVKTLSPNTKIIPLKAIGNAW